jgi:hypothetical protein
MNPVFSQELFEEFDVFAVQIKSTLDHAVKLQQPMFTPCPSRNVSAV